MKKGVLLFCILIVSGFFTNAYAQYAIDSQSIGDLTYKRGKFKNEQGVKLTESELRSIFDASQYVDYEKGMKKRKTGKILTGIGIGCMVAGTGLWTVLYAMDETDEIGYAPFAALYGTGLVCTIIGIPKTIVANNKLKRLAKEYNQTQVTSSFGIQEHGVGLAFTF